MGRFAVAALIIITTFNSANATKFNAPPGIPECSDDAHKLCFNVLFDVDKRLACMRAHRSQLSQECIAAIKRRSAR
jgi:hypothetical protein